MEENEEMIEYKEVCQSIRHYSNLRWLMLPVFLAVNAGLYEGAHGTIAEATGACDVRRWVPFILAVLFIEFFRRMDGILNEYLAIFRDVARGCNSEGHWSKLEHLPGRVRPLMNAFYVLWVVVWLLYVSAPLL